MHNTTVTTVTWVFGSYLWKIRRLQRWYKFLRTDMHNHRIMIKSYKHEKQCWSLFVWFGLLEKTRNVYVNLCVIVLWSTCRLHFMMRWEMSEMSAAFHLHSLWHVARGPGKMNPPSKLQRSIINVVIRGTLRGAKKKKNHRYKHNDVMCLHSSAPHRF